MSRSCLCDVKNNFQKCLVIFRNWLIGYRLVHWSVLLRASMQTCLVCTNRWKHEKQLWTCINISKQSKTLIPLFPFLAGPWDLERQRGKDFFFYFPTFFNMCISISMSKKKCFKFKTKWEHSQAVSSFHYLGVMSVLESNKSWDCSVKAKVMNWLADWLADRLTDPQSGIWCVRI